MNSVMSLNQIRHTGLIYMVTLALAAIAVTGCSSEQDGARDSKKAVRDSLPHDPYSAPLYAASRLAKAADFTTPLLNGGMFQLSEQRGKVVVLNVWATWCPPCEEETPALVDIYEQYRDRGLVILGVSIDEQGRSVVEPFVEKHKVSYPVTIDDGRIMDKYGPTMGIPTTYIIGPEGNLRYFATGAITKEELVPRIEKLLKARSG